MTTVTSTEVPSGSTSEQIRNEPTLVYGWSVRGAAGLAGTTQVDFYDGSDDSGPLRGMENVAANELAHGSFANPVSFSNGVYMERSGNCAIILYHEDD